MIARTMKAPIAMPAIAPPERLDDVGLGTGVDTGVRIGAGEVIMLPLLLADVDAEISGRIATTVVVAPP